MKGKVVQSLINLFPQQYQDTLLNCVIIIGFDKLIRKGYLLQGVAKMPEITQYADKLQQSGRLVQLQEPFQIRHELEVLREELTKLTQQVQYSQMAQKSLQTPDDRKRSASVGFRQNKMVQSQPKRQQREITPKVTETVPQTVNQIQINIQKHHLDDTEIKSIMRDNFSHFNQIHSKEKPPKPQRRSNYTDEAAVEFEDTDRYPVKETLQYSQMQSSQQSVAEQNTHHTHNTNQTFAQPQSSQKHLVQSKSMHIQKQSPTQRSPGHKSPKFKYQSLKQQKNLETVQEESSHSHVKHVSTHSASSKGRGSHRHSAKAHMNVESKIKADIEKDKKIYKIQKQQEQQKQEVESERAFINPYDQPKPAIQTLRFRDHQSEEIQEPGQQQPQIKRSYQGSSFYKPGNIQLIEYEPKYQQTAFQGSVSMTHQNSSRPLFTYIGLSPPKQAKIKNQFSDSLSPGSQMPKQQYKAGKQESDFKRSDDFNRSSVSSNFSMFNPNDELKMFFQNDFLERRKYVPSSDLTKQQVKLLDRHKSSISSSQEHNPHQSKYISEMDDYPRLRKEEFSQDVEKSNVFQNNRLSVTRILNNSQM